MNDTPLAKPPTPELPDDSTEARGPPLWRFNQLYHQVDQHNPHLNGCCPEGAIPQNELASLPTEFARVGKLSFSIKRLSRKDLRQEKK
jgi:hypothetical protein